MKKRVLTFLLLVLLVFPVLASCNNEEEPVDVAPSVYVVYGITEDGTTPEAIKAVELEMNRYLLQKADIAIKLYLFPEDEYEKAVADAFQMMVDQELEESVAISISREQAKLNPTSRGQTSSIEGTTSIQTEDVILDILEAGGEIETKNGKKRFDIFLCQGYENYYNYITGEDGVMLQRLDTVLTSDAKVLLDYIYPSFINPTSSAISAARVNGATYGIPNNGPIGEYQYLVFDKEYLRKYEYDALSMKSLQDLEEYLSVIKQNEPDVIPLYNVYAPNDVEFLYQEGYPVATDSDGYLFAPYLDVEGTENKFKEHYRLINTYKNLGYIGTDGYSADADFAVRFISGNTGDITALSNETGKEYDYIVYKNPVATAENTLDYTFCLTKYCASTDVPEAMKFLVLLNTDDAFRNMFLYGVEDLHYLRDRATGAVTRLNNDYRMSVEKTGNCYITWPLEGEDLNKWDYSKLQNLDSTISPFISFVYERQELSKDEPVVDPDESGDEPGDESIVDESTDESTEESENTIPDIPEISEAPETEEEVELEPDYQTIFTGIINKYYSNLINGEGDFDATWNALQAELVAADYAIALRDSFLVQLKNVHRSYPTGVSPYPYMNNTVDGDESAS